MGLPGSGKTTLAERLKQRLEDVLNPINEHSLTPISDARVTVAWLNADIVRKKYDDWDFSISGRIRQSLRMRELADTSSADYVICDFVCPLPEMRNNFQAHWRIWVDTIPAGRFADTNNMFVPPTVWDFRITEQDADKYSELIVKKILAKYLHVDPTLSS